MGRGEVWAALPFHFWSVNLFVVGCVVGSFLNVVIHRLPRGENIVIPPSHCPHCGYHIPWYLNIPLFTWLWLRGQCAECKAPISARYFLVELLTGVGFLACWLKWGPASAGVALCYCVLLGLLIPATFIDLEHFIIPDGITLGGAAAGFVGTWLVPQLHGQAHATQALEASFLGMAVGGGFLYLILRLGKLLFGQHKLPLAPGARVIFAEHGLILPDHEIPYEEIFYRPSDTIVVRAHTAELVDRGYWNVTVRLQPHRLRIGDEVLSPEEVPYLEVTADQISLPREAMGLGDVKFMLTLGAFLGWVGALFALMASAFVGTVVGVTLIALRRHSRANPLPYGPYLATGAVVWIFCGRNLLHWWLGR